MPDRILSGRFGDGLTERGLTDLALTSYPYICRAFCFCGGAEDNPRKIQLEAFDVRPTPTLEQVARILDEYQAAGLLERWTDDGGIKWCWLTRWFGDNYFHKGSKPACPRPPSLTRHITIKQWEAGFPDIFRTLFKKGQKASREEPLEVEEEVEKEVEVEEVFAYYRTKIQPLCRDLPKHISKIKARLKKWEVNQLKKAIDNKAADRWFMQNNASRGAAWFFLSDERIEGYINATPDKSGGDRGAEIIE